MAAKGAFKPPVEPLSKACDRAMEMIDGAGCRVAIFMVAGAVTSTKSKSQSFQNNVDRLANHLVGVYDIGADARRVREDLAEFYAGAAI
jgi:hypothetical protein